MFEQQQTNDLEQNDNSGESTTNPPETVSADKQNTENDENQTDIASSNKKPDNPITSKLFAKDESTIDDEFEEIIIDIADLVEEDEYSVEERAEMEQRYSDTMRVFRRGELVSGKIVNITATDVAVDIGFKSEGSIPHEEFKDVEKLTIGDDIEVCIDRIENREGSLVLSKRKAEFYRVWERINDLYKSGEMLEAEISRRIKGGMIVDLFGIEAFLPGSQIDVHPVRDFDALVGMKMDFRIIKVNNVRKNIVLSHKVLVEESLQEIRAKVLSELEEAQVVEGVVKNITDFGVFVDLGGVDGLLHITDLAWGRVSHPSDVVSLDEKIQVKVLSYDKEKQRISLGLKQLKEHNWDKIEVKYPLKSKVKGKVVSIVKYGAFIELEDGVEGLVHISEMSWTQHVKHPSQIVNVDDEVDVIILNVDRENRKISLGIKQIDEDPWERLEQVFLSGTRHKGTVRDLVPFGAFVELEPGIDGLIHISDLSWTRKVRHPGEIVKKAQEIEVVILKFDRNERRIALGYKQLKDDPWDGFEKSYPIRSKSEGSVIRVLEKGVVVMLPAGVEGFVPNSQLGKELGGENKKNINEGDNIELQIIEFDRVNHRIVLSHSAIERGKERSTYRSFREPSTDASNTIGALVGRDDNGDNKTETSASKDDISKDKITDVPAEGSKSETVISEEPKPSKSSDLKDDEKQVSTSDASPESTDEAPVEEKAGGDDKAKPKEVVKAKEPSKKVAKSKAKDKPEESDEKKTKTEKKPAATKKTTEDTKVVKPAKKKVEKAEKVTKSDKAEEAESASTVKKDDKVESKTPTKSTTKKVTKKKSAEEEKPKVEKKIKKKADEDASKKAESDKK